MKISEATPAKFVRAEGPAIIAGGGGRMMLELHSALILFMGKGGEETALPVRPTVLPSRAVARSPSCGPKINYDGGARAARRHMMYGGGRAAPAR